MSNSAHNVHEHLQAALDFAADGNISASLEHLVQVYTIVDEEPFLLWDDKALFDLGSAFLLMYHYDLSEREQDQISFAQYAFLFLSRAMDLELNSASGSFADLYGQDGHILEITKNLLMLVEQCEDELSLTLADMLAPAVKTATPDNAHRQKAIEQARVALRLIQVHHLEVADSVFPDFADDEFLIEFSNDLESEYGLGAKDAEMGKQFQQGLFEHIAKSV